LLQYQTKVTKEEEGMLSLNKKGQKAVQANQDAILAVGQTGEAAFEAMATAMEKTYSWLGKNTKAAIALGVALASVSAISSVQGAMPMLSGLKNLKGLGGKIGGMFGKGKPTTTLGVMEKALGGGSPGKRGIFSRMKGGMRSMRGGMNASRAGGAINRMGSTALRGASVGGRVAAGAGAAGAVLAAGAAGFAVGTWLDKKFGWSDKLGKKLSQWADKLNKSVKEQKKAMGEQAGSFQESLKGRYGDKFEKKLAAETGGKGLESMSEEKRLETLSKIAKELRAEEELRKKTSAQVTKEQQEANRLLMEYQAIQQNLKVQLDIQNQLTQAIQSSVTASKEFLFVNQDQLAALTASAQMAAVLAQTDLAAAAEGYGKKIAEMFDGADIGIDFTGGEGPDDLIAKLDKAIPELLKKQQEIKAKMAAGTATEAEVASVAKEIKEVKDDEGNITQKGQKAGSLQAQITGAVGARKELGGKVAKADQQQAAAVKAQTQEVTSQADMQMEMLNIQTQRIQKEKELYEAAHFGMGVSVELLQKQIELEKQKGDVAKKAQDDLLKKTADQTQLNEDQVKAFVSGNMTREEALKLATEENMTADQKNAINMQLGEVYKEHNKYRNQEVEAQTKIMNMTKQVREGYLDAMAAMLAGAGEFSGIIGTQEKGVSQLMGVVEEAGGELKGLKVGGLIGQEEGLAAGRGKAAVEFTPGGVKIGRTKEEEKKAMKQLGYDMDKSAEEQARKTAKEATGGIGSEASKRPDQVSAIAAAKGGDVETTLEAAKEERTKADEEKSRKIIKDMTQNVKESKAGEMEDVKGSTEFQKNVADESVGIEAKGYTPSREELKQQQKNMSDNTRFPGKGGSAIETSSEIGKIIISVDKDGIPYVKNLEGFAQRVCQLENALTDGNQPV
jgi:hypothetical protein